ncbi:MAG: cupin domain-containing protein [Betaproteobacteria bacterium]|nr:cupin domain-containing protein [Betaproteobacteria bacterium]MDH5579964.1 cupin domain-containing protein [Betaproteobacteria bacterium]
MKHSWHATTRDAAAAPIPDGRRSAEILRNGSLEVRWYAPRGSDPQTPHDRDEVYVVASGRAAFVRGSERVAVGTGDLLFVPAGMEHRFEELSGDFATWVMFYGPLGGERDNPFAAR